MKDFEPFKVKFGAPWEKATIDLTLTARQVEVLIAAAGHLVAGEVGFSKETKAECRELIKLLLPLVNAEIIKSKFPKQRARKPVSQGSSAAEAAS